MKSLNRDPNRNEILEYHRPRVFLVVIFLKTFENLFVQPEHSHVCLTQKFDRSYLFISVIFLHFYHFASHRLQNVTKKEELIKDQDSETMCKSIDRAC